MVCCCQNQSQENFWLLNLETDFGGEGVPPVRVAYCAPDGGVGDPLKGAFLVPPQRRGGQVRQESQANPASRGAFPEWDTQQGYALPCRTPRGGGVLYVTMTCNTS